MRSPVVSKPDRDDSLPLADDWQARLHLITETMREMSAHTDPQQMVRSYAKRMTQLVKLDRRLSLSRRGLASPYYRITRSTTWTDEINPWRERHRLPLLAGGLLADLIYGGETQLIEDLEISPDDPAYEFLSGHRSLLAIPMYDEGESLNMVIQLQQEPYAFDRDRIPEIVWQSNLFGRATAALVLREELREAYLRLDRELKIVGEIQHALLPATLPEIPTLDLATYYQPAQHAGGDYYDFFPLPENRWGILIADVSGHGPPAAVVMAVTHAIAHTQPGPRSSPAAVLNYLNSHLADKYARLSETFVTAFYGVFDPERRTFVYSSAGHNPPQVKRCYDGTLLSLNAAGGIPLGITTDETYDETEIQLRQGDQIIFYTDGIIEMSNREGEMFGTQRLHEVLGNCALQAQGLLDSLLLAVDEFAQGRPADDDRTVIVARVR